MAFDEGARAPSRFGAPFVRTTAFVRKELGELFRQPRILALLVLGPFLLLALFGAGYSQSDLVLRAAFVAPEGSVYEDVLATYEEDLEDFIDPAGTTSSEADAIAALDDGDVDVVVVFPEDPVGTVLSGERAVVRVVHDEIDPLAQTAIWIAARVAVQEVNANVLSAAAGQAQEWLAPAADVVGTLGDLADDLEAADGEPGRLAPAVDDLNALLARLDSAIDGSSTLLVRLDGPIGTTISADVEGLADARAALADLRTRLPTTAGGGGASEADEATLGQLDAGALAADLRNFAERYGDLTTLDAEVLVRPFDSTTESLVGIQIDPSDYFAPAALALLLQHLGVTFAALSLVRDRSTGLFELLRISPLASWQIVTGKAVAYLLTGGTVAAILLAAAIYGLDIPMVGSVAWLAVVVAGVVLASLALGMLLSMLAGTESQAVQFAMLSLLAGLFFSGFVLSIDDLAAPVRVVSYALPVTYGIRALQDVMFRGDEVALTDLVGLAGLTVGYGTVAVVALRAKLRIA